MKSSFLHFIIAVIIGGAVLAGYGAWYKVVTNESTSVANLQSQISAKTKAANNAASARATIAEIASSENALQGYFVPQTGVVGFINGLEAQGQALGTTVSVLSVSAGTGKQPTFMLSLTIEGTFDTVMRTVGVIEYAPYDISLSQFSLNQDAKNSWHANLGLIVGSTVDGSTDSETATSTP